MNSEKIKDYILESGADLCGIASAHSFLDAPKGYHPTAVYPECQSVIVFALKFLKSTLECNTQVPYTIVRNMLSDKMDKMAVDFCSTLESKGIGAVPAGTIGYSEVDKLTGRTRGIISAKHAAELAGLGKIGKNTLLITPEYGNMVWLSVILTNKALEPDKVLQFNPCPDNCSICIDKCPVGALGHREMDQQACWDYAFGEKKGLWQLKCCNCRRYCPHVLGSKNK